MKTQSAKLAAILRRGSIRCANEEEERNYRKHFPGSIHTPVYVFEPFDTGRDDKMVQACINASSFVRVVFDILKRDE